MAFTEKYVRADAAGGGNGTTDTNSGANGAWTLAEAIAAYAAGQRLNVKSGVGTYANTTTSRTFATAGTTTAPIVWRGFVTTIGDIDSNNALTKPAITFTTGRFIVSAIHQTFQNLDISGAATAGAQVSSQGGLGPVRFVRCRMENTGANAASSALNMQTASNTTFLEDCWLKAPTSATRCIDAARGVTMLGCVTQGGAIGVDFNTNATTLTVFGCVFFGQTGAAIKASIATGRVLVNGCSIYAPGGAGVEFSALPSAESAHVCNCLFSLCGTYDIHNSTGTDTNLILRSNNLSHAPTLAHELGFGDSPDHFPQTDSSSPFTNAAGSDFSLVSTSNARANGLPGGFENQSYTSYLDIGAVQRQDGAGYLLVAN